jgi:hypothetical protein
MKKIKFYFFMTLFTRQGEAYRKHKKINIAASGI